MSDNEDSPIKSTKITLEKRPKGRPNRPDSVKVINGEEKKSYYPRLSISQENIQKMFTKIDNLERDLSEIKQYTTSKENNVVPVKELDAKETKKQKVIVEEDSEPEEVLVIKKKPKKKIIYEEETDTTETDEDMQRYLRMKALREKKKKAKPEKKVVEKKPRKIVEKYYDSTTEQSVTTDTNDEYYKPAVNQFSYRPRFDIF